MALPFSPSPSIKFQINIVPCHASTDVSCLPFSLSAALRLQLHNETMRLQARLAERKKYGAISRHLTHDRTLVRNKFIIFAAGRYLLNSVFQFKRITFRHCRTGTN